ncbi:MAG: alpha/beta fold hydrolase [Planctomycetota bacterium]
MPSARLGERLRGHLWTVLPTARDLVLRPRLPSQQDFEVPVVDDHYGPTALSCSLAVPEGADSVVVLVHGLGGSRRSGYVQRAAQQLHRCGFATLALDLRGADLRGGGFYHVALTADLEAVCRSTLLQPFQRIYVLGFSMGGHAAVHFAATSSDRRVAGVAALCSPLDLSSAQQYVDGPGRACYRHYVLRGLKTIYEAVSRRQAVPSPAALVWRCRTIHEWDRLTIAPHYGYASPEAFYEAQSARLVLPALRVETVLVLVQHDPIVPPQLALPHIGGAPVGRLHVCVLPRGGHLQFPADSMLGLGGPPVRGVTAQLAAFWARGDGASRQRAFA